MADTREFLRTLRRALNPDAYVELSRRSYREASSYLVSLLVVAFLIMGILYIPTIAMAPGIMNREFSKISKISIIPEIEMSEPIFLGPDVVIDMTGRYTNVTVPRILVMEQEVYYKPLYETRKINITDYGDVEKHRAGFLTAIWIAIILISPALLILLYIVYLVKYLILIFLFTLLFFIISNIARLRIRFSQVMNIGVYSSTIMVLGEAITRPILGNAYFVPIVLFIIYFATATLLNAERKHDT